MERKFKIIAVAITCILYFNIGQSQSLDSLLLKGIDLVHHERFEEAFALFDTVIAYAPDKPVGYFFKAAAYSNLAADYRNLSYSDTFFKYIFRQNPADVLKRYREKDKQ